MARGVDRDLIVRLDAIREEYGDVVRVDQIAEVVRAMLHTTQGDVGARELKLFGEIESLANYIHAAKEEIATLCPSEINDEFISSATDELDAIIGATENATNEIMDAAERLESLTPVLDPEIAERLLETTTRLFEACTFQDITGQRITKVVKTLKEIETRVENLTRAFGPITRSTPKKEAKKGPMTDEDLLNGPQLPAAAVDQGEIDRLFG